MTIKYKSNYILWQDIAQEENIILANIKKQDIIKKPDIIVQKSKEEAFVMAQE
jgi:hypothetical protein